MIPTETAHRSKPKKFAYTFLMLGLFSIALLTMSETGTSDFSTSSSESTIIGNVINSEDSFSYSDSGLAIATTSNAGSASSSPQEITDPKVNVRLNAITAGNFVYKVTLTEATVLTSGTWSVSILKDGTSLGSISITQGTGVAGTTEGATILVDMGTSLPNTNIFEVRVTQTA